MKKKYRLQIALVSLALICQPAWSQDDADLTNRWGLKLKGDQLTLLAVTSVYSLVSSAINIAHTNSGEDGNLTPFGYQFKQIVCNGGATQAITFSVALRNNLLASRRAFLDRASGELGPLAKKLELDIDLLLGVELLAINGLWTLCGDFTDGVFVKNGRNLLSEQDLAPGRSVDRYVNAFRGVINGINRLEETANNPRGNPVERAEARAEIASLVDLLKIHRNLVNQSIFPSGRLAIEAYEYRANRNIVTNWYRNGDAFHPSIAVLATLRARDDMNDFRDYSKQRILIARKIGDIRKQILGKLSITNYQVTDIANKPDLTFTEAY